MDECNKTSSGNSESHWKLWLEKVQEVNRILLKGVDKHLERIAELEKQLAKSHKYKLERVTELKEAEKCEAVLREAIEAWECPACNGSGIRENSDVEHYETVACYKCAWKRTALEKQG